MGFEERSEGEVLRDVFVLGKKVVGHLAEEKGSWCDRAEETDSECAREREDGGQWRGQSHSRMAEPCHTEDTCGNNSIVDQLECT